MLLEEYSPMGAVTLGTPSLAMVVAMVVAMVMAMVMTSTLMLIKDSDMLMGLIVGVNVYKNQRS